MTKCTPEEARGLAEQSDWCFCGYCQNIAPLHRIARLVNLAREPMAARLEVLEREHTEFFDRWHDERRKREAVELERDALREDIRKHVDLYQDTLTLAEKLQRERDDYRNKWLNRLKSDNDSAWEAISIGAKHVPGEWYVCHSVDEMQVFFMSRLPAIRAAARELGYAIGVHGSCRRDFDLMAMPWRDDCAGYDDLAKAIQFAACGITASTIVWEQKPNGRMATSLCICWSDHSEQFKGMDSVGHIDLSLCVNLDEIRRERDALAAQVKELREALIYHQEQTRPICRTREALARTAPAAARDPRGD